MPPADPVTKHTLSLSNVLPSPLASVERSCLARTMSEKQRRADRAPGPVIGEAERACRRVARRVEAFDRTAVCRMEHAPVGIGPWPALGAQAAREHLHRVERRLLDRREHGVHRARVAHVAVIDVVAAPEIAVPTRASELIETQLRLLERR